MNLTTIHQGLPPAPIAQIPVQIPGVPPVLLNLIGAILILIIGWLVAIIAASLVGSLLRKTNLDDRLVRMVGGGDRRSLPDTSKWVSAIVFWIIFIIAIVAFLEALNLTTVSQPLNSFLDQIFAYLPRVGAALLWAALAWLVATIARLTVIRIANSFHLDDRLTAQAEPGAEPFLLSETLGNGLYWFVFLFFLPLILGVLNLQGPLGPVQNLLNSFLAALPRIVEAVIIGVVGWFIARVVRGIVTNLLAAAGADRLSTRLGLRRTAGNLSVSGIIGTIVYVLILLPVAIAALDALNIQAVSVPASAMLNQVLNAIPQIFTAALILIVAYVIGQFVADLVSNVLTSLGFDGVLSALGLSTLAPSTTPPPPAPSADLSTGELPPEPSTTSHPRSPSQVVGLIVWVGIMLFAAIAATNILNIPALTTLVSALVYILGRVLVGLVVFAVGLYLANLVFRLLAASGSKQARILGQAARVAILALTGAMALQQMGIATDIVNLAFGLLLGAIAVAVAIAFGLGGRDVAAEQLRDWLSAFRR
ncbi:MAG TPA: mechanosensitive ion channel [Synechococcales cyanobacterium M55_K2018_004]|nr:mechanosensitive ion channel [Synechococcales cyanobacterium M55_K2018_004]